MTDPDRRSPVRTAAVASLSLITSIAIAMGTATSAAALDLSGGALANTGVDTAAMTVAAVAGGGVLVLGAALFGFSFYRKRREPRG